MTVGESAQHRSRWLHRFAIICASATFILIFAGGLVTSTGSALAVPDWPLAYGHLIPNLVGGVRFEYGHRVVAGFVVILTTILALWTWRAESRSWVRKAAFAALGLIVVQAVLGGITVLLLLPLPIAVAHAATAQAFFCLMVALALFTNPEFGAGPHVRTDYRHPRLATVATITTAVVYVQILIGALTRHLGAGLAIPFFPLAYGHFFPQLLGLGIEVIFAHRCGAVVVSFFVLWTVIRVIRFHRGEAGLLHAALLLLLLLSAQISLGALTIWSGRAVLPTTAHVAIGAAVLATSLTLAIRAYAIGGLASASKAAKVRSPFPDAIERKVIA
ncbi:MAG: COX15/CtaA family protein [Candidatus Binataceae bacterium]